MKLPIHPETGPMDDNEEDDDSAFKEVCKRENSEYYMSLSKEDLVAEIMDLRGMLLMCDISLQRHVEGYHDSRLKFKVDDILGLNQEGYFDD
jgi:hypothetical protein